MLGPTIDCPLLPLPSVAQKHKQCNLVGLKDKGLLADVLPPAKEAFELLLSQEGFRGLDGHVVIRKGDDDLSASHQDVKTGLPVSWDKHSCKAW